MIKSKLDTVTMTTPSAKERLIVALDVPTVDRAKELVHALEGVVSFFKIGLHLQMAHGLEEFIQWLIEKDKKVFLDYKYNDVDETVRQGVDNASKIGITFLTVHGNGSIVRAAIEGRGSREFPKILMVTVLTSLDADDLRDLGFPLKSVEELVLYRARKALEAGCDGVIASGEEAKSIRDMAGHSLLIVTPGVRPEGSSFNDHKRFVTPYEAIKAGADYLVVGRPILRATDPRKAALAIVEEIQRAVASTTP